MINLKSDGEPKETQTNQSGNNEINHNSSKGLSKGSIAAIIISLYIISYATLTNSITSVHE